MDYTEFGKSVVSLIQRLSIQATIDTLLESIKELFLLKSRIEKCKELGVNLDDGEIDEIINEYLNYFVDLKNAQKGLIEMEDIKEPDFEGIKKKLEVYNNKMNNYL